MSASERTPPCPADLGDRLNDACRRAGYPPGATLIRHFANAVYLLNAVPVVARVGYGLIAYSKARTAITATRWLTGREFPITEPASLPSGAQQPLVLGSDDDPVVVTFWRYYPQPTGTGWPDTAALGRVAAALHRFSSKPPGLADYLPLRTFEAVLQEPAARLSLTERDHEWLTKRIKDLRREFDELDFPLGRGLIHADLYNGNLLWNTGGDPEVVLGDWDSVCLGPREVDLIPTYAEPRFGVDPATVDAFAAAYGYDLRRWAGYETLHEIRELSTLTALIQLAPANPRLRAELDHRLGTLVVGDRTTRWHGQ